MDINILKIASDTKNNKHIHNCTHSMKYKSQICGDEIEIFLIIKDNVIKDFSYQSQSCIYCNASANLATDILPALHTALLTPPHKPRSDVISKV